MKSISRLGFAIAYSAKRRTTWIDPSTSSTGAAMSPLAPTAVPGIALLDLDGDPDALHPGVELRCFAGYSGWSEGQLEDEIDEGAWFVVDPAPDDPFVRRPSRLWQEVLARQPGPLARYALYPSDPSVN